MSYTVSDAHCDTLFSVAIMGKAPSDCAVRQESLAAGHVGLQTFAMFSGGIGFTGRYLENAKKMLNVIDSLQVPFITKGIPQELPDTPHGILSIEGGEILEGNIQNLYAIDDVCRVRMLALTWNNENEIAYPALAGEKGHIKPFGRELLAEMDALGVLPDVSHLNVEGFFDVAEYSKLPPIASHSNARALCDKPRNLLPEQIDVIIEKKGYIGINFYSYFLAKDRSAVLEDVFRHIDAIAEKGGIDALGFGSDFDGIEAWPEGLASPADFPNLLDLLEKHGYTPKQIRGIAGENLLRVLQTAEAERSTRL